MNAGADQGTNGNTGAPANQPNGQSTAGQPAGQGSDGTPSAKDAAPSVPEKYESPKLPDGFKFEADELTAIEKIAKERKLDQAGYQRFVDDVVRERQTVVTKLQRMHESQVEAWKKDAIKDSEYGGEKLAENLALAESALQEHGTDGLREVLTKSGLANHPEVVRFFYRVGKLLREDTFVKGKGAAGSEKSPVFNYPNSKHN